MPVISPLAALSSVLQSVCRQASDNGELLKKNEAATRAALIDPVLRALGWDTANVRMVEPEKTIGSELRVDYLLYDSNGMPQVVVEAKCLGSTLDKHGYVSKVLGYALGFKVRTVFITDGLHWHCYTDLHKGSSEPIMFELSEAQPLSGALQLVQRLDSALFGYGLPETPVRMKPNNTLVSSFTVIDEALVTPKPKKPEKPAPVSVPKADDFVALAQVNTLQLQPGQKPTQLRLPNGSLKPIKKWKDILLESCRFVLTSKPHLPIPFHDKAGKKTYLFNIDKPETGSSSSIVHEGRTIYIYTNYSAKDCIANALHVLSQVKSTTVAAVAF